MSTWDGAEGAEGADIRQRVHAVLELAAHIPNAQLLLVDNALAGVLFALLEVLIKEILVQPTPWQFHLGHVGSIAEVTSCCERQRGEESRVGDAVAVRVDRDHGKVEA